MSECNMQVFIFNLLPGWQSVLHASALYVNQTNKENIRPVPSRQLPRVHPSRLSARLQTPAKRKVKPTSLQNRSGSGYKLFPSCGISVRPSPLPAILRFALAQAGAIHESESTPPGI